MDEGVHLLVLIAQFGHANRVRGERSGGEAAGRDRRRKDAELQLAGYRVVRFTWRQIADEPDVVGRTLRALLGRTARRER